MLKMTPRPWLNLGLLGTALLMPLASICVGQEVPPNKPISEADRDFFEAKIRPVLVQKCYACHSNQSGNARGGLRLDTRRLTLIGGSSGAAVVPGDVEASLLFSAINHDDFVMPPDGDQLSESVIEDFRKWIQSGAPDPRTTEVMQVQSTISDEQIAAAKNDFWAYRTPRPSDAPDSQLATWARTDIDRFVAAKLSDQGLAPAPDAPPMVVLRRLTFDLIGLPPEPELSASFERRWKNDPDAAISEAVDELLRREQFGERWGRYWLDAVRYAESTGRGVNMTYPHAWRYRDYVIDSFNDDKPYDRFLQEQLAGDLLPVNDDAQWAENLIATTFLAMGPKNVNEQNRTQFFADVLDEQIDVTTRVMLGTSVACARCHDHKFDPIRQTDYYALAGVFSGTQTYFGAPASSVGIPGGLQNRRPSHVLRLPISAPSQYETAIDVDQLQAMKDQLREVARELVELRRNRPGAGNNANAIANLARLTSQMEILSARVGGYEPDGQPISFCMGVQQIQPPGDVQLLVRGEIDQPGQRVPGGFPEVLRKHPSDAPGNREPGVLNRLALARWITDPENPLTARVMVNRIWQHLIGAGIVSSPENFGSTGSPPSHPELLDQLAIEFVQNRWSVKSMVRKIATSRVYRIESTFDRASFEKDPENRWLWRAHVRRLDAEAIRDAMLYASGQLDLNRPSGSFVAQAGYMRVRDGNLINIADLLMFAGRERGERTGGRPMFRRDQFPAPGTERLDMTTARYRSVYLPIVRDQVPRMLEVFDFAEPSIVVGQRETSNTANQALFLMNNPFVIAQADQLARRVFREADSPKERYELLFELTTGGEPTSKDMAAIGEYFRQFDGIDSTGGKSLAWSGLCQAMLASSAFRILP